MISPRDKSRTRSTPGFTMVELLVVLAIVGILMGLAVPMARMFIQGTQERGARELYALLRAARVYAATYRVTTAVAYQVAENVSDTLLLPDPNDPSPRTTVEVLRGAMMVYELPSNRGAYAGKYVPVPGWEGFRPFPEGYAVLLNVPPEVFDAPPASEPGMFQLKPPEQPADPWQLIASLPPKLGLRTIRVITEPVVIEGVENLWLWNVPPVLDVRDDYPAHVFDQTGKLIPPEGSGEERYRIFFAPMPDRVRSERLSQLGAADPEDSTTVSLWLQGQSPGTFSMIGVPIEIYRSTGRVDMGKL